MSCAADLERNRSLAEAQIQEIEWVVVWVDKILEEGQRGKSVSPHLWMLAFRLCDPESEINGRTLEGCWQLCCESPRGDCQGQATSAGLVLSPVGKKVGVGPEGLYP